jgi:hypothetical protein
LFPNGLCRRRVVAFYRRNIVTLASTATFYNYLPPPPPPPSSILASILSSCSTPGVNELASWLDGLRLSQYWAKRRINGLDLTMVRRHSGDLAEVLKEGEEREGR